jgi:hypothetical protein
MTSEEKKCVLCKLKTVDPCNTIGDAKYCWARHINPKKIAT